MDQVTQFFQQMFSAEGFPARWLCGQWTPFHGWLYVLSDIAIWGAYTSIPVILLYFVYRKKDVPFPRIFWLFAAFIYACGTTHLFDAIMFWWPAYRLTAVIELATAAVSWATVFALIPILPQAFSLKSPQTLERIIDERTNDLTKAKANIERTEERLRLVVEGSDDGIFDWDIQTGEIYWNERQFEILGLSRETFKPTLSNFMALVHPEDRKPLEEQLQSYMQNPGQPYTNEYRIRHASGKYLYFISKGKALQDESGKVVRMAGVNIDMTERKQLEIQIEEARNMAEIANHRKSQFLANMSHELRTPLNAIIGYSEMLGKGLGGGSLTEKDQRYIQNVVTSGHHLLNMVNDILDLSKVEAGRLTITPSWVDINPILQEVTIMVQESLNQNQVTLKINAPSDLGQVYADPLRLRQILLNLLSNAIKFNKSGGTVDVDFQYMDNTFTCQVKDTGIGIPADQLKELFQDFYQVNPSSSRQYEGTGLGLALTKSLIALHGGTITVASEEGVGSTFTFTLPHEVASPVTTPV